MEFRDQLFGKPGKCGELDYLLRPDLKAVWVGPTAQVIQITLELPVVIMTAGMILSSQGSERLKEASDYFTSRKTTTSGNITPIIMPARVLTPSLPRHLQCQKQLRPVQPAGHAAMSTVEMASRTESMTWPDERESRSAVC